MALDAVSGAELWSVDAGDIIFAPLALADGVLYAGTGSQGVLAVDPTSGARVDGWESGMNGRVFGDPFPIDGRVYALSAAGLQVLDGATGALLWQHGVRSSRVVASVAADENTLFFGVDARFYALDRATLDEHWSADVGEVMHVSVANGLAYCSSSRGLLRALDAETGAERWQFQRGDALWSSVAVTDAMLYVGNSDHSAYALDALTGEELWRFVTDDWVLCDPVLVGSTLFIGTGTHMVESGARSVYALDAATGTERWRFETSGLIHEGLTAADGLLYAVASTGDLYALG
jgi:outer membrane protein assembly factor BamB